MDHRWSLYHSRSEILWQSASDTTRDSGGNAVLLGGVFHGDLPVHRPADPDHSECHSLGSGPGGEVLHYTQMESGGQIRGK